MKKPMWVGAAVLAFVLVGGGAGLAIANTTGPDSNTTSTQQVTDQPEGPNDPADAVDQPEGPNDQPDGADEGPETNDGPDGNK
ncbi:hypothetical protein ACFWNN_45240 [Lentzea sp. NPDC058450]|uniref:hypothetical protein n=1 Tax=Lentzea sp. NPDC058450 TaxID=3346505 RepID=UPI00365C00F0